MIDPKQLDEQGSDTGAAASATPQTPLSHGDFVKRFATAREKS